MIKHFFIGIKHFIGAYQILRKNKLLKYYAYPIIVSILLYVLVFGWVLNYAQYIVNLILPETLKSEANSLSFSEMSTMEIVKYIFSHGLSSIILSLLIMILTFKISKYIVLIILSPIFSIISEKIEEIQTGHKTTWDLGQFIKDIIRGIIIALRNMGIELFYLMLFGVLGLMSPFFAPIYMIVLMIISSYFYGFSMIDYTLERRKMNIQSSVRTVRRYKFFAIGLGIMYWMLDKIPIIGLIIAPINAVVGASTGILELEKLDKNKLKA